MMLMPLPALAAPRCAMRGATVTCRRQSLRPDNNTIAAAMRYAFFFLLLTPYAFSLLL